MRVERHIVLIGCLFLWIIGAKAQPRLQTPEFYVGFHGGVSVGTVLFSPKVSYMTPITNACVLGGNGGLVFRYAGHKYCAFQMELNYLHRGWAEGNAEVGRFSRSLHYLELPIFMHLNFGSATCRWFLNFGPQIGYCVWDEGNAGSLVNGDGQTEYQALDHRFDWGLAVGTGLSFYTPHAGIYQFEFRYDFSFGGVFGTNLTDHYTMASPMDLSLNFAWLWPIKKQHKYED